VESIWSTSITANVAVGRISMLGDAARHDDTDVGTQLDFSHANIAPGVSVGRLGEPGSSRVSAPAALIDALRGALAERKEIGLALLFGSFARGRARPDSDVDVAVLGRNLDLLALAADLADAVKRQVDVVDLGQAGYPLTQALLRDGIVVHQGAPGAAAAWRTRAILETETDRPWFERMRDAYLKRLAELEHG
jgi:predicted nucleotidyltransferase